jgi:diphosphomevalonate decarboxylase
MKATAKAPANIAFIKYWGKHHDTLRLPLNSSISMNLTGAYTVTTVEFSPRYAEDSVELLKGTFSQKEIARVVAGLTRIRERAGKSEFAKVVTENSFPKGAGSAASASGFAALAVAGFAAAGASLTERELTIFARMGSGSACRSIPDGFVEWESGDSSETSVATSLHPSTYWDIRDALVIVDSGMKKVSTSEGMETVTSSPLLSARLAALPGRIERCRQALSDRDFTALGEVTEEDCLDMHEVMRSQTPPLQYWNGTTRAIVQEVRRWRSEGLAVYFTIDAGPNVHVLYEGKNEQDVMKRLSTLAGVETVIYNKAAAGTALIDGHLF